MLSVSQKGVDNVLAENELCVYLPILLWKKKTTNIAENLKSNAQRFESHWEFFLCIFIQFK